MGGWGLSLGDFGVGVGGRRRRTVTAEVLEGRGRLGGWARARPPLPAASPPASGGRKFGAAALAKGEIGGGGLAGMRTSAGDDLL